MIISFQEIFKAKNQECNFTNDAKLVIRILFNNTTAINQHEEHKEAEEKDMS